MQLGIPSPPRPVSLGQVPGALGRLALSAGVAVALVGLGLGVGRLAGRALSSEREFFERAVEVPGQVGSISLPPLAQREGGVARISVIYAVEGRDRSASGVELDAVAAEELARGNTVTLLVDPASPEHPREARYARARSGIVAFGQAGLGLGLLFGLAGLAWELRRAVRRELEPLRRGMLVWLTPDGELPATRGELVFPASYYRDDVKYAVQARARPGRAPVRNGEKLLAAVVPSQPTWVRVIDEDLAKTLGWYR